MHVCLCACVRTCASAGVIACVHVCVFSAVVWFFVSFLVKASLEVILSMKPESGLGGLGFGLWGFIGL